MNVKVGKPTCQRLRKSLLEDPLCRSIQGEFQSRIRIISCNRLALLPVNRLRTVRQ